MVGRRGFEPRTNDLKGRCSTIELSTRTNRLKRPGQNACSSSPPVFSRVSHEPWEMLRERRKERRTRRGRRRVQSGRYYVRWTSASKQKWEGLSG